jgi:hypothetical protein
VVEIEFFLTDEPPDDLGQREEIGGAPKQRPRMLLNPARVGAVLLLGAAAALAVVASFQRVYTVRVSVGKHRSSYWVDGWGRFRTGRNGRFPPGLHDPRWGVALCICAGGLVVLMLAVAAVPALPERISRRVATGSLGAAVAFVGALAGLLAAAWLEVESRADSLRAQLAGEDFGLRMHSEIPVGPFLWLGLASVLAGAVAIATIVRLRRP